eukprot:scaffold330010_cov22-Prasinocladus_malaysianus.AAC.1
MFAISAQGLPCYARTCRAPMGRRHMRTPAPVTARVAHQGSPVAACRLSISHTEEPTNGPLSEAMSIAGCALSTTLRASGVTSEDGDSAGRALVSSILGASASRLVVFPGTSS